MSGDVERLAEVLREALWPNDPAAAEMMSHVLDSATYAVLASDWLAAHDAEIAARALREAARYFEYEMANAWGRDEHWISTGSHVADLVGGTLRGMAADRVAGHAQEDE